MTLIWASFSALFPLKFTPQLPGAVIQILHKENPCHGPTQRLFQDIKLPTVPEVGQSLIHTLNDEDVPFERVRGAISKDPALTAKLVRLANSARFALPRSVGSLDEAITMVGLNQVRTLPWLRA